MTYAVVIAARMGSDRLPGKVLSVYSPDGTTNLEQIVRRWKKSLRDPTIIVSTTTDRNDDAVNNLCDSIGVPCSRGHPTNVVKQIDRAIERFAPNAKYIARGMADNPLVDVSLADWRLDKLIESKADGLWYGVQLGAHGKFYDLHERITYAGTGDVWPWQMWREIASRSSGSQLEHPGTYYWENLDRRRRLRRLPLPREEFLSPDFKHQPDRTELDDPLDLEMFRMLWREMWHGGDVCLDTVQALAYLKGHPAIAQINSAVRLKTQSKSMRPRWYKFRRCQECSGDLAMVIERNNVVVGLDSRCPHCGTPWQWVEISPQANAKPSG